MPAKKIINSTTCWAKNKLNYAIIFITVANQEKIIIIMRNRTITQFDLFLTQQCNSIYNLFSIVIATRALNC